MFSVTYIFLFISAFQLCGSEEFWEQAVRQRFNAVSAEVASLALEVGWRSIFFTSKLQLQKLISRRRLKAEEQQEGQLSEPDAKTEGSPSESLGINQPHGLDEASQESPDGSSEIIQPHGLESHPGVVSNPILCIDTATSSGTSRGDIPDLNPKTVAGSDSNKPVSDQFLEDTLHCEVETLALSSASSNGGGDFSTELDNTQA